jgi:ATP-dependent DNA helicase RecG
MDVDTIVAKLRAEGSDTASVEVKSARGGLPESMPNLLSAFANQPGGGIIILGLDENQNFAPCGVYDLKAAQQSIASMARKAVDPPVRIATRTADFEGSQIVVITVLEAEPMHKPVRVIATEKSYFRQYDGTYPLSALEEQAFIAARSQTTYDRSTVPDSSMTDLDQLAVAAFVRAKQSQSSVFRQWDTEQILNHSGVIAGTGEATLAGLLALGTYPQQFFPNLAIQASSWSGQARRGSSSVLDTAVIEGPIASMLDDAEAWVARNTATAIVEQSDGDLYDSPAFPPRAVRELVANALIHRDLGPYATSRYISLTLEPGRLTITNPGGLFGVALEALGHTDSSLRNGTLASIMMSIRSPSGKRVIERLGSGIPSTREAMRRAQKPEPVFFDTGISFTAKLFSQPEPTPQSPTIHPTSRATHPTSRATHTTSRAIRNETGILSALAHAPATVKDIARRCGLSPRQVRYALRSLIANGQITSQNTSRNILYSINPTAV